MQADGSLLPRIQKAAGADRALDAAILAWSLGPGWSPGRRLNDRHCAYYKGGDRRSAPMFTRSLEAITDLVERKIPGCKYIIDTRDVDGTGVRVKLFPPPVVAHSGDRWTGRGATPALAMCAALLSAQTQEPH